MIGLKNGTDRPINVKKDTIHRYAPQHTIITRIYQCLFYFHILYYVL